MKSPNLKMLARLYFELEKIGARSVGEYHPWKIDFLSRDELLVLACDWSRHDPRLFGILVDYFHHHWESLNPLMFRRLMSKMETPQTLLTILNFASSECFSDELRHFYNYLTHGYNPVEPQLYFYNLYKPGGTFMLRAVTETLEEFSDWGFLGRERPILYGVQRKTLGHWNSSARANIVNRLLDEKKDLTLNDYLDSVDHSISRQQAIIDLKKHPRLKVLQKGRGSYWKIR